MSNDVQRLASLLTYYRNRSALQLFYPREIDISAICSAIHLDIGEKRMHQSMLRVVKSFEKAQMAKKALILVADGTEEMEFTIAYDTLVRAGVECTSANVQSGGSPYGSVGTSPALVVCSRGIKILPDTTLQPLEAGPDKYDALVIPGGLKGAETLSQSTEVQTLVREYFDGGKIIGTICAGTLAAKTAGLPRQPVTSHPVAQDFLTPDFEYKEDSVVVSKMEGKGTLVSSRGPGTAFPFAFKLVELLCGKAKSDEVRDPMMFPPSIPYPY